jgi:hypothetical protein
MIQEKQILNGWKSVKLGDVCERILGGGTPFNKSIRVLEWKYSLDFSADIEG